jgi:hypothetical protein
MTRKDYIKFVEEVAEEVAELKELLSCEYDDLMDTEDCEDIFKPVNDLVDSRVKTSDFYCQEILHNKVLKEWSNNSPLDEQDEPLSKFQKRQVYKAIQSDIMEVSATIVPYEDKNEEDDEEDWF